MGHSSKKHCELCLSEPAIRAEMVGCPETDILIANYKKNYKPRHCVNCGKRLLHYKLYHGRVTFLNPSQYAEYLYCDSKCRAEFFAKKKAEEMEKAPERFCEVCGNPILKKKYKNVNSYMKAKTCSPNCLKQILHTKSKLRLKFADYDLIDKFAKIDSKYE